MRIENMTKETIKELPDVSLRNLKIRFIRMYERYFSDPEMKTAPMDDKIFYNKYMILREEMKQRGIEFLEDAPLDKKINTRLFTKSVWGIDIAGMNEITIMKSYVAASGAFIKSPKLSKEIDVVIRNLEENRDERLEKAIEKELKTHTKKTPNFIYSPAGPDSSYIPMFDLVLSAREETKRINVAKKAEITKKTVPIEKPEETDVMISLPVGPACEVTATITIDKEQGITALYCGKVKKVRTFKFDKRVKAWTMATARAWIKEHKEKLEKHIAEKLQKQLEENLETFEYLIHHVEVDGDEEIVHHCNMYDHLGNLFEQAHLYFDKGKVYLDGKEIKEGHYHIIKGLEPKQEVAWSEEEATKAGIKPKEMMSGMTLKEKAKVW